MAHDWPGNIRELHNSIERAVILADGGPLRLEVFPPSKSVVPLRSSFEPATFPTKHELKQRERDAITWALAQSNGKVSGPDGAAALLGIPPTTLFSRITALGLKRKPN